MRSAKGSVSRVSEGRWRVSVELPRDPATGRRRRMSKTVRGSRADAEAEKARLLLAPADSQAPDMPLADYVERFFLPRKERELKRKTVSEYRRKLRLYVLPRLGAMPLRSIAPRTVALWLDSLGGGAKAREALRVLSSVLSCAMYDQMLPDNPCARVRPPKPSDYEPQVLDAAQIRRYLDAFVGSPVEAAVLLAIGGGLRRGEVCGLDVSDIDAASGEVRVGRTCVVVDGVPTIDTPKSRSGYRTVHLPDSIMRRLSAVLPPSGPVVCSSGARMHPDAVSKAYRRVQASMPPDLPRVPFKNLRHSSLTLAYESGADMLALQERGGHSSISVTERYYLRPQGGRDREIADAMDAALAPRREVVEFAAYADTVEEF